MTTLANKCLRPHTTDENLLHQKLIIFNAFLWTVCANISQGIFYKSSPILLSTRSSLNMTYPRNIHTTFITLFLKQKKIKTNSN